MALAVDPPNPSRFSVSTAAATIRSLVTWPCFDAVRTDEARRAGLRFVVGEAVFPV